jgi:hypothetical protein
MKSTIRVIVPTLVILFALPLFANPTGTPSKKLHVGYVNVADMDTVVTVRGQGYSIVKQYSSIELDVDDLSDITIRDLIQTANDLPKFRLNLGEHNCGYFKASDSAYLSMDMGNRNENSHLTVESFVDLSSKVTHFWAKLNRLSESDKFEDFNSDRLFCKRLQVEQAKREAVGQRLQDKIEEIYRDL